MLEYYVGSSTFGHPIIWQREQSSYPWTGAKDHSLTVADVLALHDDRINTLSNPAAVRFAFFLQRKPTPTIVKMNGIQRTVVRSEHDWMYKLKGWNYIGGLLNIQAALIGGIWYNQFGWKDECLWLQSV